MFSVTEREIELGVLNAEDTCKNCLWFNRVFDDIDDMKPSKDLAQYYGKCILETSVVYCLSSFMLISHDITIDKSTTSISSSLC